MEIRVKARPLARGQRGFSIVEALIAAGLLLIITLGILPLFTSAIRSNETGREYMDLNNVARSRAEEMFQLRFEDPDLEVTAGSAREDPEYFSARDRIWKDGTQATAHADSDAAVWVRTTVIRNYNIKDLATPLAAGAALESIHMKEIEVTVETGDAANGPLGPARRTTVRLWKSL